MSSRNQKATALVVALFILTGVLCTFGALIKQETRIKGTIAGKKVDIPAWLQTEPEYDGKLKNVKVEQGWGWARFLFFLLACGPAGLAIALIGERRGEIPAERKAYEDEELEKEELRKVRRAYKVGLTASILKKTGEAKIALHEDALEEKVDSIRAANGWFAPEPVVAQLPPQPPVLRQPEGGGNPFEGMKTPAEYAAEIEAARLAAIEKLPKDGGDVQPADEVPDDRKTMFQQRGTKIMRSLAALKMSILSAAPTGAGKTHTLYKWLGDLQTLYPDNDCYVIAHKRDSFLGLLEKERVAIFDDLNPELALYYLDVVYKEMKRRLNAPEHEREEFKTKPVRLILDDWFASYGVIKLNPALWNEVKVKLGAIITKGREANVCLYIATQSFNLEAIGVQDSNIRGNLAITCQGLVTEKIDEYGEIVEQGNYESIQLLIDNKFIVSSRGDRERLNAELEEIIALSRLHQVPAMFAAVGKNTLALAPYYEKPIAGENLSGSNVAILDRNDGDDGGDDKVDLLAEFNNELARRGVINDNYQAPDDAWNDDSIEASEIIKPDNPDNYQADNGSNDRPKWLPSDAEIIKAAKASKHESFSKFLRKDLGITNGDRYKVAKPFITKVIIDHSDELLIDKFELLD